MTQLALGLARKRAGMDRLERSQDADFIQLIRSVAVVMSSQDGQVSTDELRRWAATRGISPQSQNSWGCIFRGAGWYIIGYKKSGIASNHGRELKIWRWIPDKT